MTACELRGFTVSPCSVPETGGCHIFETSQNCQRQQQAEILLFTCPPAAQPSRHGADSGPERTCLPHSSEGELVGCGQACRLPLACVRSLRPRDTGQLALPWPLSQPSSRLPVVWN